MNPEVAQTEPPAHYAMPQEFPNLYTLTTALIHKEHGEGHDAEAAHAPFWVNPMFSAFYAAVFIGVVISVMKRKSVERPSRLQMAVEALFGGLSDFFGEVLGKEHARKFVPYVGSLWIFIVLNNLFGLIPLLKSPTGHFQTTIALGLSTFCYVNYQGIREGGIRHFLWHLCGSPRDKIGYGLAPLMFLLELISTLIRPLSLSLRLFGNIFGEDKLLASFLGLGMMIVAAIFRTATPLFGLPLHIPFLFLAALTSVIQATVFALLSAVYISLLLPHEEHEGQEGAAAHAHSAH